MTTIGSLPAGRLTLLAEGATGAPRVSGDGKTIVWAEATDGHWAIMKHSGGVTTQVSEDGYDCTNPAVSDDGSVIAYARLTPNADGNGRGSFDVYQCRNGETSPVATGPGNEYSVAVSGDGSTIAWDDDIDGTWMKMWRVGKWQNGETTLLTDGTVDSEFPFIENGTNRVYMRQVKQGNAFLSAERPGDGLIEEVAHGPGDTVWPDVTAGGKTLMWTDNSGEFNNLLRCEDGKVSVEVSEEGVDNTWSRMSNDGTHMTWTQFDRRGLDPSQPKVHVMYRDGENQGVVAVSDQEGFPCTSDLSNDGKTLAWMWVANGPGMHTRIYMYEQDAATAK